MGRLRAMVHLAALSPLAILIWDLAQGQLTANPIREVQLRTGKTALVLLVLTLACTPVYRILRVQGVLPLRRTLGLYTFFYVSLHFLNFLGVDYRFDVSLIREDLFEKRYAVAGFATFLLLLPLAVTSTRGWMKRLGRNWERLHWAIYLAAVLDITHYVWQTKADFRKPVVYAGVVAFLLVIRLLPLSWIAGRVRRMIVSGKNGSGNDSNSSSSPS